MSDDTETPRRTFQSSWRHRWRLLLRRIASPCIESIVILSLHTSIGKTTSPRRSLFRSSYRLPTEALSEALSAIRQKDVALVFPQVYASRIVLGRSHSQESTKVHVQTGEISSSILEVRADLTAKALLRIGIVSFPRPRFRDGSKSVGGTRRKNGMSATSTISAG